MTTHAEPLCLQCRYFQVTWKDDHPYACHFFEVETRIYPSIVVFRESGQPCQAYEPRRPAPRSAPRGGTPDGVYA